MGALLCRSTAHRLATQGPATALPCRSTAHPLAAQAAQPRHGPPVPLNGPRRRSNGPYRAGSVHLVPHRPGRRASDARNGPDRGSSFQEPASDAPRDVRPEPDDRRCGIGCVRSDEKARPHPSSGHVACVQCTPQSSTGGWRARHVRGAAWSFSTHRRKGSGAAPPAPGPPSARSPRAAPRGAAPARAATPPASGRRTGATGGRPGRPVRASTGSRPVVAGRRRWPDPRLPGPV